jgi:hypothetical protein
MYRPDARFFLYWPGLPRNPVHCLKIQVEFEAKPCYNVGIEKVYIFNTCAAPVFTARTGQHGSPKITSASFNHILMPSVPPFFGYPYIQRFQKRETKQKPPVSAYQQTRTAFNTNNAPRINTFPMLNSLRNAVSRSIIRKCPGVGFPRYAVGAAFTFGKGRVACYNPPCPAFYSVFVSLPSIINLPKPERNCLFLFFSEICAAFLRKNG